LQVVGEILTPLPSSGGSQHNQSNSNAISSPINVAAHNILSLAKRNPAVCNTFHRVFGDGNKTIRQ